MMGIKIDDPGNRRRKASTALDMTRDKGRKHSKTIRNELKAPITVAIQKLKGASAMKLDVSDHALEPRVNELDVQIAVAIQRLKGLPR